MDSGMKYRMAVACVFMAGAALIIASASGEFWMDEAWSALLVSKAEGLSGVYFIKNDNSHLLNSLWLYLLGPGKPYIAYRIPSILAGMATLAMVGRMVSGWSRRAALLALSLTAFSYPLTLYFSEARGYGTAVAFAMGSMIAAKSCVEGEKPGDKVLLWFCLMGGMLSHLTFLTTFFAVFLYAVYGMRKTKTPPRETAARLAGLFAVPALATAVFLLTYTSGIEHGAGSASGWLDAVSSMARSLAGQVTDEPYHPAALAFLPVFFLFAWVSGKDGRVDWPMIFMMLGAAPLAGFFISMAVPNFYMRFLITSVPFFLLAAASALSGVMDRSGRLAPLLAGVAASVLVAANLLAIGGLALKGRAHYGEAVRDILSISGGRTVDVAGDNISRHALMLDHHLERMGEPGAIRFWYEGRLIARSNDSDKLYEKFTPKNGEERDGEFFLVHRKDDVFPDGKLFLGDLRYRLLKIYPYFGGPSGWNLYLYVKEPHGPTGRKG